MESTRPIADAEAGTRQQCTNCVFFLVEKNGVGACRRKPPVVVADGVALQPQVGVADWCGEWSAQPETEGE
jgi:hypothetical protein